MNNRINTIEDIFKQLKTDERLRPSPAFRTNARIRLLNAVAPVAQAIDSKPVRRPLFGTFAFWFAVVILFISTGSVFAAQSTHPGNPLFAVKVFSERAALALSPTESIKTSVAVGIIDRRAQENELAKQSGDDQVIQQSVNNFESSVSNIKHTHGINQRTVESELEKHVGIIEEYHDESGDENETHDREHDVKGAQTRRLPFAHIPTDTGTPSATPTQKSGHGRFDWLRRFWPTTGVKEATNSGQMDTPQYRLNDNNDQNTRGRNDEKKND